MFYQPCVGPWNPSLSPVVKAPQGPEPRLIWEKPPRLFLGRLFPFLPTRILRASTGSPVAWKALYTTVYHNLMLSQPSPGRCALQDPSSAAAFGSWTGTSLHRPTSAPPGSGDSVLSGAPDKKSPALPWCLCFSQTSHKVHSQSSRLLLQNISSL